MANKKFCPQCAKESPYGSNFCNSCGANLNSLASKPNPPPQKRPSTFTPFIANSEEDDDDDNYLDRINHLDVQISKLEIEINHPRQQKETVGSVFSQGINTSFEERGVGPYAGVKSEDFLKQFSKEAGSKPQSE